MNPIVINEFILPDLADNYLRNLWNNIEWSYAAGNRREYYCNDIPAIYTYGTGRGERTYVPMPYVEDILEIKDKVQKTFNIVFQAVVLNGYTEEKDNLEWHADDSPTMDDNKPIVVVSLGAARNIFTRPNTDTTKIKSHLLTPGSCFYMPSGYQDTHQHRIPKHDRPCGRRLSLTFRGYVDAEKK